jgi:hypothetical protein
MRLHHLLNYRLPAVVSNWFLKFGPDVKQFYFGDIMSISGDEWIDLQNYAVDLVALGKFQLPFEHVSYAYECGAMQILGCLEFKNNAFRIALARMWRDEIGRAAVFSHYAIDDLECAREIKGVGCKLRDISCYPPVETKDQATEAIEDARDHMLAFMALTVMLSAKGVEVEVIPAPEKLNKCRTKKGRPPISEIRTVHIRIGGEKYTFAGERHGHHASPRLHWRRGHIRRLPSGGITNVVPCLVGNVERGVVKHDYDVRVKQ